MKMKHDTLHLEIEQNYGDKRKRKSRIEIKRAKKTDRQTDMLPYTLTNTGLRRQRQTERERETEKMVICETI